MSKRGVKKGSAQAASFAATKTAEKQLWTVKVIAYTQQEILDAVELTLHEYFGFGPKRQKRFHDGFMCKYDEICALEKTDDDYAKAKIEQALQAACGEHYSPREERYDMSVITPSGEEIKI